MKKILALLVVMIMTMTLFTGCGSNQADSGEEEGDTLTLAEMIESSTWKYDDSDAYIHIAMNHTYQMAGADMEPGQKVTFWKYLDDSDDTIVLYNEFGGEEMTLTASGNEQDLVLTDDNGDTLSKVDKPMNGIYKCGMDKNFVEGDMLSLNAEVPVWVPDYEVQTLERGSVISMTDYDAFDTEVESIEKQNDKYYIINGSLDLVYDEDAGAWAFDDGSQLSEYVGQCQLTDKTQFVPCADMEFKSLEECLDGVDGITASVKVADGAAEEVAVIVVE